MQFIKKPTNSLFLKKYFFIPVLGTFLGIAISYFLVYSEAQENVFFQLKEALLVSIVGTLVVFIISKTSKKLNKLLPYQTQTGNRLFIGFIVHFLITYLIAHLFFYIYQNIFSEATSFYLEQKSTLIKLAIILIILALIFEVIYFALYSYYSYSKFQIETVKQERKQIELQLKALKSQISPHFLFNSLNTISSLVFKDESKAESFIRKLANMYNFTLQSYSQKLISVKEELEFVDSYVYLLQTRFKDKFKISIAIDEVLMETKIPPLTLQMLVENAVKHNQLTLENPLDIILDSNEKEIIIQNNITEPPKNVVSFKVGLKNINKRYLLLVNKAISITKGEKFIVKIPIIK